MSFLGSLASGIGGIFGGAVDSLTGGWIQNSAKESLNKNISKSNLKIQKEYDLWTQERDKEYNKWWQDYLYDLQNNQYYALSQKYATNTAKWAVEGLKAAGLNPILAAQNPNMSSNLGSASPALSPVSSTAKGSVRGANVSGGGRAINSLAFSQLMNSAQQRENMQVEKQRSEAEIRNLDADTMQKQLGDTALGNNLIMVGSMLDRVGLKKPLVEMAKQAANWMTNQLGIAVDGSGSTAKTVPESIGSSIGEFVERGFGASSKKPPFRTSAVPSERKRIQEERDRDYRLGREHKRQIEELKKTHRGGLWN